MREATCDLKLILTMFALLLRTALRLFCRTSSVILLVRNNFVASLGLDAEDEVADGDLLVGGDFGWFFADEFLSIY